MAIWVKKKISARNFDPEIQKPPLQGRGVGWMVNIQHNPMSLMFVMFSPRKQCIFFFRCLVKLPGVAYGFVKILVFPGIRWSIIVTWSLFHGHEGNSSIFQSQLPHDSSNVARVQKCFPSQIPFDSMVWITDGNSEIHDISPYLVHVLMRFS